MRHDDDRTMLLSEVARDFRVGRDFVKRHFPATLVAGKRRYLRAEVEKFLRENTRLMTPARGTRSLPWPKSFSECAAELRGAEVPNPT